MEQMPKLSQPSSPEKTQQQTQAQTEALVTTYLTKNPKVLEAFLANNPKVIQKINLPSQHQNGVTDFHNFKAQKLEKEISYLKAKNMQLLEMSVDNLKSQAQIHTLVLDILNAHSLKTLLEGLHISLQKEMAIDHIHFCIMQDAPLPAQIKEQYTPINATTLNTLFKEDSTHVILRTLYEEEQKTLHGPWAQKAASDGLLKIATPNGEVLGLLALVSADQERFHKGQGTELLNFIAQVIGHVMAQWTVTENMQKTG